MTSQRVPENHKLWQCLFYGLDDDLPTGLVFYGCDHSVDGTLFYRLVVDRLEMYNFLVDRTMTCWTRQLLLSYFTDGLDCMMYIYFADGTQTFRTYHVVAS